MIPFFPREWWKPSRWSQRPVVRRRRPEDLNRAAITRWITALAFCVCFAALAPAPVFLVTLANLLLLAGVASVGVAALQKEHPLSPHFTAWDEAAWSATVSFGLRAWLG